MAKAWASDEISIGGKTLSVKYIFARSAMFPSPENPDREFRENDMKKEWQNFLYPPVAARFVQRNHALHLLKHLYVERKKRLPGPQIQR